MRNQKRDFGIGNRMWIGIGSGIQYYWIALAIFTVNLSNQAEEEANVDFKPVLEKLPGKFKISPNDG